MIKLRDDMCNSCQLNFKNKNKITCNEEVETYIIFACDNLVYPYLYVDKKFDLYEGKTKVGEGIIIKIVEVAVSATGAGALKTEYQLREQQKRLEQNMKPILPTTLHPNMKNKKKNILSIFEFDFSRIANLLKVKTGQKLIYGY